MSFFFIWFIVSLSPLSPHEKLKQPGAGGGGEGCRFHLSAANFRFIESLAVKHVRRY